MCEVVTAGLTALLTGTGGATAAGATAAAGTAGAASAAAGLAKIGTILSVGGSLYSAYQGAKVARDNAARIEEQKKLESQLTAQKENRERFRFRSLMAKQRAELAGRGVQLDSATAVVLGRTAAQEMAFSGQSIRSDGLARQAELSSEQRAWRSRATSSVLRGTLSAAGTVLNSERDRWLELA